MMGLSSTIAQDVWAGGSLKYAVLVSPGSAINAQRVEDFVVVRHWSVPPGKMKLIKLESLAQHLLGQVPGDISEEEA